MLRLLTNHWDLSTVFHTPTHIQNHTHKIYSKFDTNIQRKSCDATINEQKIRVTTVSQFDQSYIPTTALTLHTQPDCVLLGIGPLEDSELNSPTHSLSLWSRDLFDNLRPTVRSNFLVILETLRSLLYPSHSAICSRMNPINTITIILPLNYFNAALLKRFFGQNCLCISQVSDTGCLLLDLVSINANIYP